MKNNNLYNLDEPASMIKLCNALIDAGQLEEALTFVSACLSEQESALLYAHKAGVEHDLFERDYDSFLSGQDNPTSSHLVLSDCLDSMRKAIELEPEAKYYYLLAKWSLENEPSPFPRSDYIDNRGNDSKDRYCYTVKNGKLELVHAQQDLNAPQIEPKICNSDAYAAIEKAIQLDSDKEDYHRLKLKILMHYYEHELALSLIAALKSRYNVADLTADEVDCLESLGRYHEAREILEQELLPHLHYPDQEYVNEHAHELVLLVDLMVVQRDYPKVMELLEPIKDFESKVLPNLWNRLYQEALDSQLLESKDYKDIIDKILAGISKLTPSRVFEQMLKDKEFSLMIGALESGLGKDRGFTIFLPEAQKAWILVWLHTIVGNADKALQAILDFDANSLLISVPHSEPITAEEIDSELYLDSYYHTPYEAHDEIINSLKPYFRFTLPYELMPLDHFKLLLSKFYYNHADIIDNEARVIGRELQINADHYSDNKPSSLASVKVKYKLLVELQKYNNDLKEGHSEFLNFLAINLTYTLSLLQEQEIMQEKEAERIRIISNLSHSIKNLVRSVINPLHNLRQELPEKINTIDFALRAANLIREMVNAINASQAINIQNFIWDAHHPDGESLSLKEIVHACLVYSIGNMFDFKYFNEFSANYFPRSLGISERGLVQQQWEQVSSSGNLGKVLEFASQYLFKCSIEMGSIADYRIGNAKSSSVNLTILFQEIIFNAIKYSSFVPLEKRFVSLQLTENHAQIRLEVSNSCDPETIARSTGQGMGIIKDFAKGLDSKPVISKTGTTYSITMEFNNIWRNDVQDSIH